MVSISIIDLLDGYGCGLGWHGCGLGWRITNTVYF